MLCEHFYEITSVRPELPPSKKNVIKKLGVDETVMQTVFKKTLC